MNKRILITVSIYISAVIILLLAMFFSLQSANTLLRTKTIEQQYGQSHILELKEQLLSNQQAINTAANNEKISLGSNFYALKSDDLRKSKGYYDITSDLSIFNNEDKLIGHFTVLSNFFIENGQVSIVDITDLNSVFRPWYVQTGGYGPSSRASQSVTASFTFSAWISSFPGKGFVITANTSLSPDEQSTTVWDISDIY